MKRRIFSIFCVLALCLGLLPVTALAIYQAPSGSGTKESPYQISTADELFWVASLVNGTLEGVEQNTAACAVLTADIDLSGQTWTPIGTSTSNYFKGTFDGDGHTISNLTIDTEASYVGLFGATSGAVIKNVTLDKPQVQNSAGGTSNTGALVGYMVGNGTVEYCAVTNGSVSSDGQYVGGLIGYFLVGTVQYCYNYETTVSSTNDTPTYVNGVAGRAGTGEYLYSSFSYVSQQKRLKASNNAQYAAYLSETSTKRAYGINGGQYGFSADQFKDGTVAYFLRTGFYGGEAKYPDWGQTIETDTLPKWKGEAVESLQYAHLGDNGTAVDAYAYFNALTQGTDGTYHIEDTSDWIAFVKLVKVDKNNSANAVVKEGTVIDFSPFGTLTNKSTYSYLVIADKNSGLSYTGTFEGNGCTVKGVSYSGTMEFALFGTIGEGGSVSGITLEKPNITYTGNGTANIAGIASHNYGAIDDCHVDGGAISTEKSTAAGIAAESFGTVKNCTNSANLTAKYQVAGIVATSNSTKGNTSSTKLMKIEGCSNSGTITATDEDYSYAGGIFGGKNRFSNDYPYGTISKCFNEGKILGQSYIGGIVGYSSKSSTASAANVTIENCYNTGAIGDDRTTGVAGGISAGTNSSVTNCFNVGAVTGTNAQPIVANGYNTQAWSDNSYASCEVNGESFYLYYGEKTELKQDESGQLYYGNGKRTDAEMASGEVAYLLQQVQDDDEQVWSQRIGEDDHPVLVSNGEPAPVVLITVKLVDDGETATELTKCYTNAGSTLSAYPKPDDQGAVYTFYTDTSCTETNKIDTATKTYSTDTTIYVKQSKLPDLEGTVTIAGTPKTGEKLTAITNGITSENLGELRYQWYRCNGDDDSNPEAISEATSNTYTVTKADTGKYIKVVVTADNYSGSLSATTSQVQANPATVSTAPAAKDNLVYTGSAQALVTAGSAEGGTMMYRLGDSSDFSADIPTGTDAKTYTVWYKVVGDENHSDSEPGKVDVTIAKKPLIVSVSSFSIRVGDSAPELALTYTGLVDGESVRPSDTPTFTITKSDNTEITLADAVKTAGTYTITWSNEGITTFPNGTNYDITKNPAGTLKVSNRSSGGTTTYPVQVEENSQNGGVQVSPKNAVPGTLVTVTPQPALGYELATLSVLDQYGNEVDVNPLGNGNYSFKMPRSRVKVEATFYCTGSELCPTHHLADVLVKAWYHDAVDYVVEHGIMTGTSATTFEPNTTLSRAMVAQILYNLEGQPTVTGESTFTDASGHWAVNAIAWAQQTGVVNGYEDNTFRPNRAASREELAQMLYNYAKVKGYDLTASGDLTAFPDGSKVSSWAEAAMAWANGNELINGHDDGTLQPGGDSTRAQAASILMSFDLNLAN